MPSFATRWDRRETLRLAALGCTMPFCAERMITGSASFKAASAWARSPLAIASSTLRTKPRIFERRPLLISVRRAILRVALRAELVLAMPVLVVRALMRPADCRPVRCRKTEMAASISPPSAPLIVAPPATVNGPSAGAAVAGGRGTLIGGPLAHDRKKRQQIRPGSAARQTPGSNYAAIQSDFTLCGGFEVPIIIAARLCRNFKSKTALES